LVVMISESSGETYDKVYKDLHLTNGYTEDVPGLFGPTAKRWLDVSELNKKQFEIFMGACVLTANEFFNMNLVLYSDEKVGTVLTTKKK